MLQCFAAYGNLTIHNCDVFIMAVTHKGLKILARSRTYLRKIRNLMRSKQSEARRISDLKCITNKGIRSETLI